MRTQQTFFHCILICCILLTKVSLFAQVIPTTVTFYGEDEPFTLLVDGSAVNSNPQIEVTLKQAPAGIHQISIVFAEASLRPIENYTISFQPGFRSAYKIRRKSVPYEKPKFYLQYFEQEPLVYIVRAKVKGIAPGTMMKLYAIRGDETPQIGETPYDSAAVFVLPDTTSAGMLRLNFGKKEEVDFIFNKENIYFSFEREKPFETLFFEQSGENQLYFSHLRASGQHLQKMYSVYQLLASYPDSQDSFFVATQKQFTKLSVQLDSTWKALDTLYHATFANTLIQHSRPYFPEPTNDRSLYNQRMRDHFFDYCKLDDPRLIYSSFYANKMNEYLNFWFNNRAEQEDQNQLFQQGVDTLLGHAAAHNTQVFSYAAQYLQKLFKQIGNDALVFHIDNKWLINACEADELTREKIQQRIGAYKQMQIGNLAPDFKATDLSGKVQQLYAIKAPLKVLFFWASWCDHCKQEIPTLLPIYEQFKKQGIAFIGISLDKDKTAWTQFVKEKQLNWLNVSELKGFDSPIANVYYIFKTPSYILLDQDNKIVSKPQSLMELKETIRNAVK